uniref:Uncharacterized protein n=1 Tax=Meloidogyne hapla TaxID=6305 RepID=A0A1I8BBJ2_MELHA
MRNLILIFILIPNFKQFSSDKIKGNENVAEDGEKTQSQSEIIKQVDFVKLKELDEKLNLIEDEIEIKAKEGTIKLNEKLMENIKILIKQAKTIFKRIDSNIEITLDPKIPQMAHETALEIYSQIVDSKNSNEHISALQNAKILDFGEIMKNGPNKLLNELVALMNDILEKKQMNKTSNINTAFSMWKTLAFGFDWNKIVENLNCPCNKKDGIV